MKSRTKFVDKEITRDGVTKTFRVPSDDPPLKVPADWYARGRGALLGVAILVLAGAISWSTWSIGSLLAEHAPPSLAFGIAGIYDLAWIACLLAELLVRFDPAKKALANRFGWGFLVVSVLLICLHGGKIAGWEYAVAGALISILAKCIWHVAMMVLSINLSPDMLMWFNDEREQRESKMAMAYLDRQMARMDAKTADINYAINASRPEYPPNIHPEYAVNRVDIHSVESLAPPQVEGLSTPNTQVFTPAPVNGQRVFTKDEGVNTLIDLIKAGKTPTIREATELLGVPQSSAQRWLAKAKAQADANTGQYI